MGKNPVERVVLVNVFEGSSAEAASDLEELAELTRSAGGTVVGSVSQRARSASRRNRPAGAPGPFLGDGKLDELALLCRRMKAGLVITQASITPLQLRRMEDVVDPCRVLDRTGLILDVFAQRARSREGQLQVELAQALYRLPRLHGRGQELSRLGGRIGTRGPGEQKLEYDRRRIRTSISRLKREIQKLRHRRSHQRERRHDSAIPSAVLIGYTNAGKTTLFNSLTRARAEAKDQMFSTLDPQVRRIRLPGGGHALLSDTVGFIRNLPKDLRVAFRATLEEITDADILIHVVDGGNPEARLHLSTVEEELGLLGASGMPVVTVVNKVDVLEPGADLSDSNPDHVRASARTGEGVAEVVARLESVMREKLWQRMEWDAPSPELRAAIARLGVSTRETPAGDGRSAVLEAWLTPVQASFIAGRIREASGSGR